MPKKGFKFSNESRLKMSNSARGNKSHLGFKNTQESKLKMSKTHMGVKKTEITKKRMSVARSGNKNPFWKGGISKFLAHYSGLRRARQNNAEGFHSQGEWENLKIQYGFKCPCCKQVEPEIKLTRDHIIPLVKGGSHYIENIQPLCTSCNCRKHDKIIEKYQYE